MLRDSDDYATGTEDPRSGSRLLTPSRLALVKGEP